MPIEEIEQVAQAGAVDDCWCDGPFSFIALVNRGGEELAVLVADLTDTEWAELSTAELPKAFWVRRETDRDVVSLWNVEGRFKELTAGAVAGKTDMEIFWSLYEEAVASISIKPALLPAH